MRELNTPTTDFAADTFTHLMNSELAKQLKEAFLLRTARPTELHVGRRLVLGFFLFADVKWTTISVQFKRAAQCWAAWQKRKRKGAKVRVFKLRCPFSLEEFQKEGEAAAQRNSERWKGKEQRWCWKNKVKVCLKLQQQLTKVSRLPAQVSSPLKPCFICRYFIQYIVMIIIIINTLETVEWITNVFSQLALHTKKLMKMKKKPMNVKPAQILS